MSTTHGVVTVIPPPEGYVVDFSNPKRQGMSEIYWIVAIGNILALAFLAQKLYTKICIDRRFQPDDGKCSWRNDAQDMDWKWQLTREIACHIMAWVGEPVA